MYYGYNVCRECRKVWDGPEPMYGNCSICTDISLEICTPLAWPVGGVQSKSYHGRVCAAPHHLNRDERCDLIKHAWFHTGGSSAPLCVRFEGFEGGDLDTLIEIVGMKCQRETDSLGRPSRGATPAA